MIEYDTPTMNALIGNGTLVARRLVWITAKDRTTGLAQSVGFWEGVDHASFVIDGVTRSYLGAGAILDAQDVIYRRGLVIQSYEIGLSHLHPAVIAAIRQYDARKAPIEMHRALFSPETGALIAPPHPLLMGFIEEAPIPTAAEGGGGGKMTLSVLPASFALTRTLPMFKSDATQRRRGADRARRYIAGTGQTVTVLWGEKDVVTTPTKPGTAPGSGGGVKPDDR